MNALLRGTARLLALFCLMALFHLLLLWLWDPWVEVPPPDRVVLAEQPQRSERSISLVFGGDTAPADAALPTLRAQGYEHAYAATLGLLRQADLAVVNLETPVTTSAPPLPLYKHYVYAAEPRALEAMRWAGIRAVSLANNHIMDHGLSGLRETLTHLAQAGITPFGAGLDAADARRGVVFQLRGVKVGLLSYLEDSFMDSLYTRSFAGPGKPGCARLELGHLAQDLRRLRQHADVVIVSVHWGRSYSGITLLQRRYGKLLVEYGADLVVGHHPHVAQAVGQHQGRPILYSLGNYAFGTEGRRSLRHGLLARVELQDKQVRRVELIPLLVQNDQVRFKPEQLRGQEAQLMLRELIAASAAEGVRLRLEQGCAVMVPEG